MKDFQKDLNALTRKLGMMVIEESVDTVIEYHMLPKRPYVSYELSEEGSRVKSLIEQFVIAQISAYAQLELRPITMEIKYTDQPIFVELIGDLWDKAYRQGIEDERNAAALDLGIAANRTNPYRSL